jgi:hypothetical protein
MRIDYIYIYDGGYMVLGIKSALKFLFNEESKNFKTFQMVVHGKDFF